MSLLTYLQQQTYKAISSNNAHRFDQVNNEVYELYIVPIFGVDFLIDVETNKNESSYSDLLIGSTYEISGIKYRHGGLLKVNAYFNYAYYASESGIEDTFTGFQKAVRDESEEISSGEKKNIINNTYKMAYTEAERVKHYLDNHCDTFTKWKSTTTKQKVTTPNFYGVKKK